MLVRFEVKRLRPVIVWTLPPMVRNADASVVLRFAHVSFFRTFDAALSISGIVSASTGVAFDAAPWIPIQLRRDRRRSTHRPCPRRCEATACYRPREPSETLEPSQGPATGHPPTDLQGKSRGCLPSLPLARRAFRRELAHEECQQVCYRGTKQSRHGSATCEIRPPVSIARSS